MTSMVYVQHRSAIDFLETIGDGVVDLICIDPPYYGIVKDTWDNQWADQEVFESWLRAHIGLAAHKLKPNGSLLMFGGIGKHGSHPFYRVCERIESANILQYRNTITWKKRRAYGKSHDYLFCREEIAWFSRSAERTDVTFNVPLLDVKRGYAGFNADYPAKSEYKRVSNVWDDIHELMRPRRNCEKPVPLMSRLIATHSNVGDLVVDFFAGTGTTGVAALHLGRRFLGCEAEEVAAREADMRCHAIANGKHEMPFAIELPTTYEMCGTCGFDHLLDGMSPWVAERIAKAHSDAGDVFP